MPVQFLCPQCRQLLSVGRRKIGAAVNCPKCGVPTIVPDEQTAAAEVAVARAQRADGGAGMMELVVYDDVPGLLGQPAGALPPAYGSPPNAPAPAYAPAAGYATSPPPAASPAAAPSGGAGAGWLSPAAARETSRRAGAGLAEDVLLVSRHAVYAQAVLLLVVAMVAFGLGFFIGRGQGGGTESGSHKATREKVVFSGAIAVAGGGAAAADDGAVVALLPSASPPPRKFSALGLRPQDAANKVGDATVAALQELGGDLVRANEAGAFQLVVPQGQFHLLVVSRHATRKAGQGLAPKDLAEMSVYFEVPGDLVGQWQYFWGPISIAGAPAAWTHTFRPE